jgi:HTH-type transcriptional regulator/antitoxin HipB
MAKVRIRKPRDLSAALAAARRRQGLTQTELAERIGIGRDYLGDIESGELGMQVTRLMQLFGELGVDIILTIPESTGESEVSSG